MCGTKVDEKGRDCCDLHVEVEGEGLEEAERSVDDGDEDVEGEER